MDDDGGVPYNFRLVQCLEALERSRWLPTGRLVGQLLMGFWRLSSCLSAAGSSVRVAEWEPKDTDHYWVSTTTET